MRSHIHWSVSWPLAAGCALLAFTLSAPAEIATSHETLRANVVHSGAHVYKPRPATRAAAAAASTASTGNLFSSGGWVSTSPAVYLVYWGSEWQNGFSTGGYTSAQAQNYINTFFGGVGGGAWLNSQTQYCQGVASGTFVCPAGAQNVTNPTGQLRGIWTDAVSVPSTPTGSNIAQEAARAVAHFGFDKNAIYMIFSPSGKSQTGFGTSWCAWHGFNTSVTQAAYAYIPYQPDAGGSCGVNFINKTDDSFGHGYFDGFSVIGGHEYAESLTDPYPTSAWADSTGAEDADKCAWTNRSGNTSLSANYFAVQPLWSNSDGGCSMGWQTTLSRIGGAAMYSPAAASVPGSGREDLFFTGSDHALWHVWSTDNKTWSGWESLGGYLTSSPSATTWGTGRLDVFGRGWDNAIYHISWNGSSWSAWERVGGYSSSGPAAASPNSGRLDVFVRGSDHQLYHRAWLNGVWQGWGSLGGYLTSDPSAVSMSAGELEVFGRGSDGALWHTWWDPTHSRWAWWYSLGGQLNGAPDSGSYGENRIDVAIVGTDGSLWRRWRDPSSGSWATWLKVGGAQITSEPAVTDPAPGTMDIFVRRDDNAIWQATEPA